MSGRVVIVGDIHGCLHEFESLLREVELHREDRLWLLGDLVDRGPKSVEVVRLARELGASMVLGNHDEKHVRLRKHLRRASTDPSYRVPMAPDADVLGVHENLSDEDIDWLASAPEVARVGGKWVLVHGGLRPGRPLEKPQRPTKLRYIDRRTLDMVSLDDQRENPSRAVHWSERWDGPWRVVYGHHARPEVAVGKLTFGLDTGAVYGGKLTAAILEDPERDRRPRLVQVAARRAYALHEEWAA